MSKQSRSAAGGAAAWAVAVALALSVTSFIPLGSTRQSPASDPLDILALDEIAREARVERMEQRFIRNMHPGGSYARVRATRQVRAMLREQTTAEAGSTIAKKAAVGARSATWKNLGPDNLGGRTHALVIDPTDANVIYAGGIGGGVWKTTDGGTSWHALTDTLSNVAISWLAMDPSDSSTLYAGTGDAVEQHFRTGARGAGIMKTTDAGANWIFLQPTQAPEFGSVSSIQISASDPKRVFAATTSGLWRSLDAGSTWSRLKEWATGGGCTDLALRDDKTPETMIMTCGGQDEPANILRSTDGGEHWEQVVSAIAVQGQNYPIGRAGLAIAPSDQNVMYASVAHTDGRTLALLRSNDGGTPNSWSIVNDANGQPGSPPWLAYCGDLATSAVYGQGNYDNIVVVDPTNPDRIFLGGVDTFRSDDGGKTIMPMSYWWIDGATNFSNRYDGTSWVHADQHAMAFHPGYDGTNNTTLFFGNDGGIFRTDNATAPLPSADCNNTGNEVVFTGLNHGYVTSLFVEGDVAQNGKALIGGLQDNGTWVEKEVTKPVNPWDTINGGDGGGVAIDPEGTVGYSSIYDGRIYKSAGLGVAPAVPNTSGITEPGDDPSDPVFYTAVEMDPNNPEVVWTGRFSAWRSTDGSATWTKISQDFPGRSIIQLAVAPGNGNIVYAATKDGTLWKTEQGLGAPGQWTQAGQGTLPGKRITSIAIDPADNKVVYVSIGGFGVGKVWKTSDGGQTWTNVNGTGTSGIPDTPAYSVAVNPLNNSMVYLGTDSGVFESLDAGATWRVANENLATTTIEDLVFAPGTSDLYAFTYGRGVYRVDVGNQAPPPNDAIEAAIDVSLAPSFTNRVNTRLATSSQDDPPLRCAGGGGPQTKSVWYRFAPPEGGSYTISTEDSNYDTVLGVFSGGPGNLGQVACDDDAVGAGGGSKLQFNANAGTAYLIEVAKSADAETDGLGGSMIISISKG
jgi:photosystem II stability/assembly factor-like uncharacterized protein